MKKGFIYISILAAAVLASCVKNPVGERTLSGTGEKTPIVVVSNVNANTSVTKAVDGRWEADDMMFAYVQHVVSDGQEPPSYTRVNVAGTEPRIQYFKVGALTDGYHNVANNFNQTEASKLTPVNAGGTAVGFYWDDFSVGGKGDENDIRTDNHGLRSFYGLCYNGGPASGQAGTHISTNLADAAGTLGWTVSYDQSATNAFKYSDLLFSPTQTPVAYTHGSNNTINGRENVLSIPFTHAMSKVTIEVICDEGFDTEKNNFENAVIKLQNMNTVATVTAPEAKLSAFATPAEIITLGVTHLSTPNVKKSFTALIAPTVFKAGIPFAKIEGVDGNTYDLVLTDAVIDAKDGDVTKSNAWSKKLAAHDATSVTPETPANYNATNGGLTLPGVHYMITVTIKKQQIKVSAIIQDWDAVSAEGVGQIQFATDVKTIVTDPKVGDDGISSFSASFDLYKKPMLAAEYGKKASTVSWSSDHWEYTPKIYWQNKYDSEHFRALSGVNPDNEETPENESLAMEIGHDVLWGTTAKHSGLDVDGNEYNYYEGNPINPRTQDVPLIFKHAMSKVSFILTTTTGDDKVDLDNANISIINTYNKGTMDLHTGNIGSLEADPVGYIFSHKVDSDHKLLNQVVIPQSLVNDKEGTARETMPTYYQLGELTLIYSNNTSVPDDGAGTYYLTTTLEGINYKDDELTAIYANGTSISDGGESETYITSTLTHVDAVDAVKYTEEEVEEINAPYRTKVSDSEGREPGSDGYITTYEYPQDYTPITTDDDKIPAVPEHYKLNETSVQATTDTFHYYKKKDGEASEQHNPGDYKTFGDKIMLYITLADKTRYVIELSSCLSGETPVTEWKRGEHYTYTIGLAKEQITFRAMIKDWVEKTGSGNANLEWD